MKEKMQRILDSMHRYNAGNLAEASFGFDPSVEYDALVVAPSYTPYKLQMDKSCTVTTLREGAYLAGYLVEKDGRRIAWIKIGSSDANCIDHIAICAELRFRKMLFVGAVGALREGFSLGDLCTPSYSIAGGCADSYLNDSIRDFVPFARVYPDGQFIDSVVELAAENGIRLRKASVFCTASIALEYYHLDEIRAFGTELIEMETAAFYRMAELLELPSAALLVVSDNSATGAALVGRTEEEQRSYDEGRTAQLPRLILALTEN